jgi:hypothetical protein
MYIYVYFNSQITALRSPCPTNKGISYTNLVSDLVMTLKIDYYYYKKNWSVDNDECIFCTSYNKVSNIKMIIIEKRALERKSTSQLGNQHNSILNYFDN